MITVCWISTGTSGFRAGFLGFRSGAGNTGAVFFCGVENYFSRLAMLIISPSYIPAEMS